MRSHRPRSASRTSSAWPTCCLTATTTKTGEPYDDLDEVYGRLLGQWATEMNHVAAIVGGFSSQQKNIGQQGVLFKPIAARQAGGGRPVPERQRVPDADLGDQPGDPAPDRAGRRARPRSHRPAAGAQLAAEQRRASAGWSNRKRSTDRRRIARWNSSSDVRKGVWSEFYNGTPVKVDAYRRNLQRAYVETLADRINGRLAAVDDSRAFFRGELKTLDADLPCGHGPDDGSRDAAAHRRRAHADRARARPDRAGAGRTAAARPALTDDIFDVSVDPESCWLDNAIRGRK